MTSTVTVTTRAARTADLEAQLNTACVERRMADAYALLTERRAVESLPDEAATPPTPKETTVTPASNTAPSP